MATLPRKLVFRILASVLGGHARALTSRSARSVNRRGEQAAEGASRKAPARNQSAADLFDQADELSGWIGDETRCKGDDLDAALVGLLSALALGHSYAVPEIRRIANELRRPGVLDGVEWRDIPAVLARIL
jgi:hypothetical protein